VSGWVDGGMRGGIRDPEARARTLTLYIDKEPFNTALELPTEDQVYALLVDASGGVVWQAAGRPDDASSAALTAAVERRLATRGELGEDYGVSPVVAVRSRWTHDRSVARQASSPTWLLASP